MPYVILSSMNVTDISDICNSITEKHPVINQKPDVFLGKR